MYMEKLALGPGVDPACVSLDAPTAHNLRQIARQLGKPVECAPIAPHTISCLHA